MSYEDFPVGAALLKRLKDAEPTDEKDRKELFLALRFEGKTTAVAARELGIHGDTARMWARDPEFRARFDALKAERMEESDLKAADIIAESWGIAQNKSLPANARVQALSLLARMFPEFNEKFDVRATVDEVRRIYLGIDVNDV